VGTHDRWLPPAATFLNQTINITITIWICTGARHHDRTYLETTGILLVWPDTDDNHSESRGGVQNSVYRKLSRRYDIPKIISLTSVVVLLSGDLNTMLKKS